MNYLVREYVQLANSVCWGECNERGGECTTCKNHDPNATVGYCCSGANHHGGDGAVNNEDCPVDAVAAITTDVHSCVVHKQKGLTFNKNDKKVNYIIKKWNGWSFPIQSAGANVMDKVANAWPVRVTTRMHLLDIVVVVSIITAAVEQ